jgi:hypothetical protein
MAVGDSAGSAWSTSWRHREKATMVGFALMRKQAKKSPFLGLFSALLATAPYIYLLVE